MSLSPNRAKQIAGHTTLTGCREPEGSDNMRVSAVGTGPDRLAGKRVSALPFLQTASVERRFWGVGRLLELGACRRNALATHHNPAPRERTVAAARSPSRGRGKEDPLPDATRVGGLGADRAAVPAAGAGCE